MQPGVWRHTSRDTAAGKPSHGLVVQEQQRLVLIDTPVSATATAELLAWVERELQQPISRAILTHVEPNGLAGARLLDEQRIPLLTLAATGAQFLSQGGPRTTNIGDVAPGGSVRVGSVELYYPGLEHRRDAVLVWLRDARVLYGGCAIKPLGASSLETMSAHERQVWAAAVRRVLQRYADATIIVPMEGEPGGPDLLHHTLRLLAAATP
jgi:glyoxylase-like metal-dependent hydrolase (beta-lactamase superfamily II)